MKYVIDLNQDLNLMDPIEFEMPDTPLEAARLVAYLLDEYTGNSLNYPRIITLKEYKDSFKDDY
jgi:hypothetical protein